jgi:hypothetical protein
MRGYLNPNNCNKAKCKTCMFGPTPVQLSPERLNEIHTYLANFTSSHICHTTNKTCFGGLEFQAKIAHALKIIEKPTVNCFLDTANEYLNN